MTKDYKNGFYAGCGMAGLGLEQAHYAWKMFKIGAKDPKNMKKALIKTLAPNHELNNKKG